MKTVPGRTGRVVIIGAGLGGLSAALHLITAGRDVTVLERADVPGGRCGLITQDGYRIDTGPSILTMPDVIEATFAAVGESMADWLTLHRLDPAYRGCFADGSTIDVLADVEAMTEQIAATCGSADALGYRRFAVWLRQLYEAQFAHFIDRNLDSVTDLGVPQIARLAALGGFRRLAPKVASFVHDERLQRLFSFQAMYAGLSPARALALYSVITYLDSVQGVYFPVGGMHALPRALADVATKHGAAIRYGTEATRIEVVNCRAVAVHTRDGERMTADVVVVNADLPTAYDQLLEPRYRTPRLGRLRYSPSCVLVHLGSPAPTREPACGAAHHVLSFGQAWAGTFTEIIKDGRLMRDPSFLVSTPTHTDPGLAPAGCQLRQILFPAPNLVHKSAIDWTSEGPRYLDEIRATLDERGFGGASDLTLLRTPADWLAAGLRGGTPFAAAHSFAQTGPLRASTLDPRVENLVRCGSNVQPGVGIPMVLISGRLAALRVTGSTARVRAGLG
jgi:phytoene desaturase